MCVYNICEACKGKEVQTNTHDSIQKIKWQMWSQKLEKRKIIDENTKQIVT